MYEKESDNRRSRPTHMVRFPYFGWLEGGGSSIRPQTCMQIYRRKATHCRMQAMYAAEWATYTVGEPLIQYRPMIAKADISVRLLLEAGPDYGSARLLVPTQIGATYLGTGNPCGRHRGTPRSAPCYRQIRPPHRDKIWRPGWRGRKWQSGHSLPAPSYTLLATTITNALYTRWLLDSRLSNGRAPTTCRYDTVDWRPVDESTAKTQRQAVGHHD